MAELKQCWNKVEVEGILVSKDLNRRTYTGTDGKQKDAIAGTIIIRVQQKINGKDITCDIPVSVFANKVTQAGKKNPSYESIDKVLTDFISLSAVDDASKATKVRINGANIQMNEFYGRDGKLISYPRIRASFVQSVTDNNYTPKASFDTEMVVLKGKDEIGADGEATDRYMLQGAIVQYGNMVDVVPFFVNNPKAINYMKSYWTEGSTVRVTGTLNFTSVTEKKVVEMAFGEDKVEEYTRSVSELIVTGGSEPYDEDKAYAITDIQDGLKERQARLTEVKDKAGKKPTPKAPDFNNLGF